MSSATLDASMTRLENIKGNKHLYNKDKIAEAEALAAEALRMANEAKMAAARLAEVKKTLSMFSNKLEKAEQSVQKDVKVKSVSVADKLVPVEIPEEETVEKAEASVEDSTVKVLPDEEDPLVENPDSYKEVENDPPSAVVSKNLVNDDVVKVVEVKQAGPAAQTKVFAKVENEHVATTEPSASIDVKPTYEHDIVEDFLDGLGVDKMCGVDDKTLGLTDRPAPPPPSKPEIFENPTKVVYKTLSNEEYLHASSSRENFAAAQRESRSITAKNFQRAPVNSEFSDPFGVDHDDLVLCGKIADLCEPPEFDDDDDIDDIQNQ